MYSLAIEPSSNWIPHPVRAVATGTTRRVTIAEETLVITGREAYNMLL
jgi:hypothetical protein